MQFLLNSLYFSGYDWVILKEKFETYWMAQSLPLNSTTVFSCLRICILWPPQSLTILYRRFYILECHLLKHVHEVVSEPDENKITGRRMNPNSVLPEKICAKIATICVQSRNKISGKVHFYLCNEALDLVCTCTISIDQLLSNTTQSRVSCRRDTGILSFEKQPSFCWSHGRQHSRRNMYTRIQDAVLVLVCIHACCTPLSSYYTFVFISRSCLQWIPQRPLPQ
jgi:hypothetical protein